MNTKVLRRGNVVTDGAFVFIVEEIYGNTITGSCNEMFEIQYGLNAGNIVPVILTEEWLWQLGCRQKKRKNWWRLPKSNPYKCFRLMLMANGCGLFMALEDGNYRMIRAFDYVHELQNLVQSLTDHELPIYEK